MAISIFQGQLTSLSLAQKIAGVRPVLKAHLQPIWRMIQEWVVVLSLQCLRFIATLQPARANFYVLHVLRDVDRQVAGFVTLAGLGQAEACPSRRAGFRCLKVERSTRMSPNLVGAAGFSSTSWHHPGVHHPKNQKPRNDQMLHCKRTANKTRHVSSPISGMLLEETGIHKLRPQLSSSARNGLG